MYKVSEVREQNALNLAKCEWEYTAYILHPDVWPARTFKVASTRKKDMEAQSRAWFGLVEQLIADDLI